MIVSDKPPAKASPVAPAERPGLSVLPPLAALAEILALLVLPAALDHFWAGFPTLSETQPHFFWLPVLLLSLQYGTVSGLLAAGIAIGLTAFLGWPDQEVGENHFSYLLRIWTQPVLWIAAALVLGQFRMRQIERKQELATELAEVASERSTLADHVANLRARCERLERDISSRRNPPARALLGSLARLRCGTADSGQELAESLRLAFGPCRASLHVRKGSELQLVARHGPSAAHLPRKTYQAGYAIFETVIGAGRVATVLAPGDEAILGGEGLVAVPVRASNDGRVIGMLKLDFAEPGEIDAGTADRLAVIADLVAPLLQTGGVASLSAPVPRPTSGASFVRPRLWRQVRWQRGTATAPGGERRDKRTG